MDYEDNDLNSQSFQLAGEESIKFSSGLHTYSLPKFDLDDNLQVHLRFDSLVESEVLLGIQSQEENQWIEDFSRESSGLEFSSSATESCSISRRNNVWSEATSSESVDLLLKSVGQDEMMMGQTIMESDICDGLDSLNNQMKPSLNQDGSSPSKIENAVCAGSTLLLDNSLESFSELGKDPVDHLPHMDSLSQSVDGEMFVNEGSRDGNPVCVGDKCSLAVSEGSLFSNEIKLKEDMLLNDRSVRNESQDDSVSMQVDPSASSMQSFVNAGELNLQHFPQRAEGSEKGDAETLEDQRDLSKVMNGQTCEGHTVDAVGNNVVNPSCLIEKADFMLQTTDLRNDAVFSPIPIQISNCEHIVSSKDTDMVDRFIGNAEEASFTVVKGDSTSHSADICSSAAGIFSSGVQKTHILDKTAQGCSNVESSAKQGDLSEVVGHKLGGGISLTNTETLSVKEKTGSQGQGSDGSHDHLEYSSSLVMEVSSTTNITHESQKPENANDRDDGLGVHSAHFGEEASGSSSVLVQSLHICDQIITEIGPSDLHLSHLDVSALEKGNERLPTDSESIGVVSNATNISSDDNSDGVHHLLLGSKITKDTAIEQEDPKSPLTVEVSALFFKQEEIVTKTSMEPSFLYAKESSQMSNEWVPYPEFEHGVVCDNAGETPSEIVGQSSSSVVVLNTLCQDEPQFSVANRTAQPLEELPVVHNVAVEENEGAEVFKNCEDEGLSREAAGLVPRYKETFQPPLQPSLGESSPDAGLKDMEDNETSENDYDLQIPLTKTEGVSLDGCEGSFGPAAVSEGCVEGHALQVGNSSPNYNEPSCDSPTIISCSEASQGEKEHREGSMGSLDQIDPGSDDLDREANKVRPPAADSKGNDVSEDDRSFTFKISSQEDLSERETISGWKPFPNTQPYRFPQTVGSSCTSTSGLCEVYPKILEDISRGSLRTSGESNVSDSSKCNAEDEARPVAGKIAEGDSAKKEKFLKDELLQSEKEQKVGVGGLLDQNTTVPDNMDRVEKVVVSTSYDPRETNASEVDRAFAFEVNSPATLSEKETCHRLKPFPRVQPYESPQTVGLSPPTTPVLCQIDAKVLQETSRECPRTSVSKNVRRSSKGNAEKTRLSPSKAAEKENAKAGKIAKEPVSIKQTKARGSNSLCASRPSPGFVTQAVQAGEMRAVGFTEGSSNKPCASTAVQTSNLPDLNTLASYALFQQPFTDFQQVQLRAQIFVYGSLIQGTAPDEAYMVAAFGESDGGRSAWENVWRLAVERLHNQKSPLSITKTPPHLHAGVRAPEQSTRQTIYQSEAVQTPGRADSSGPPSVVLNPIIPFSSPMWTLSTPCREQLLSSSMPRGPFVDSSKSFLPLQPYQSPHGRHYLGNTTPWLSQAPSPGTWVVTPQTSALSARVHHSTLPISETVHVTSVRESPVPLHSGMQHASPSPFIHTAFPSSGTIGKSLMMDARKTTIAPTKQASVEFKPRKKKTNPVPEDPGQLSSLVQPQRDPVSLIAHLPTSVATMTAMTSASKVASSSFISTSSPESSTHYQIIGGGETEQRIVFSEMCSRIAQAKQHAEDAAALAATAVRHSQSIWSQLAIQKNSGVVKDVEAKLASSAVAIAAAVSVAKAAAAVAKVASDAALQAKLMADESLVTSSSVNPSPETSLHDDVMNLGRFTPTSILKGRDKTNNSDSALVAVRETARKRVEAASAAAKRAENLDAVLKAAEMTAEAVSQAGTIIAMGEPLPFTLTELVDTGPEGYWKVQQTSSEQCVKSNNVHTDGVDRPVQHFNEQPSNKKETKRSLIQGKVLSPKELSRDSVENNMLLANGMHWDSVSSSEKGSRVRKSCTESDLSKTIGVVPESQVVSASASITIQNDGDEGHQLVRTLKENSVKEGSLVEVRSDKETVWFTAKVLSLKDGKACVCYTELLQDEGSSQPTEWVPLDDKGGDAPRIRIAHPMSVIKYEGMKKRSRAARGEYTWSIGDKVDAWIRNGWWEGIITEKNMEDETNFTVHFPAQGETSVVRAWYLRPSLIWEDGKWTEWCRSMERNGVSHEGKPPKKSRYELETGPAVEARGRDKMSKHAGMVESGKPEASKPLMLSAKEKVFTVGNNGIEGKHCAALGTKHTGLQKEGSRVIFGVPKPGKKRKFMEVSKHYVSDKDIKVSEGSDSIKFAKFLIPQDSASRGWKSTSKVASKGKRIVESKPKMFKSGKSQSISSRNVSGKDGDSDSVVASLNHGSVQDHLSTVKVPVSRDGNTSEKPFLQATGFIPSTKKTAEGPAMFSSHGIGSDALSSKKKTSSDVAAGWQTKGKAAPLGERFVKNNEKEAGHDNSGKSIPNVVEPRRSNRKIQPTSRLLEGLQSSLIISKIPAVSHDKGSKAQQRSSSSRGNNHG